MILRVRMAALTKDVFEPPLLRYSRWALAVTVASMPLYVVRFRIGPIPTTLLEVLILLTIGLYAVARFREKSWRPVRTSLDVPIFLLLIAGVIGIVVSPNHVGAIGLYRAYFIEPVVMFYVAIDLLRTPQQFRTVLLSLAIGATTFAVMNLGAWGIALARHETIQTGNAPEALFTSPNSVALFLEPPLALAAGFALYARDRRERGVAMACVMFLVAALVFTLSRGGLLTLAVLALAAVITMPKRRLKVALLGGALLGAFAVSQIPFVQQRLAHQLDPNYNFNTFEGRLQIWSDTLHMLRDHPVFGSGLRAYGQVMVPYVTGHRTPELYPHNVFLAMWSELGLLGLTAFAIIVGILLWRGWRGFYRSHDYARPLLWGTSAAFVTLVVHGLVDTPYYENDLATEFWIVAALQVAVLRVIQAGDGNQSLAR